MVQLFKILTWNRRDKSARKTRFLWIYSHHSPRPTTVWVIFAPALAQSIFQYIHTSLIQSRAGSRLGLARIFRAAGIHLQNATDFRCDSAVSGPRQLHCIHKRTVYLLGQLQGGIGAAATPVGRQQPGVTSDATLQGGHGHCGVCTERHGSIGGHQVSTVPESGEERTLVLSAPEKSGSGALWTQCQYWGEGSMYLHRNKLEYFLPVLLPKFSLLFNPIKSIFVSKMFFLLNAYIEVQI